MDFPKKIGTSWHTNFWDRLNELIPDISEDEMIHAEVFANRCRYDDCAIGRAECAAVEVAKNRM